MPTSGSSPLRELEPEERVFCSLLSNLMLGVPLVVISLIAGAM